MSNLFTNFGRSSDDGQGGPGAPGGRQRRAASPLKTVLKFGGLGAAVILAVLLPITSYHVVPAGHMGVVSDFGDIAPTALDPGLHWAKPWVIISDFNVQFQKADADKAEAGTSDMQPVIETLTVNYEYDPTKVSYVRNHFGSDSTIEENFIVPALYEAFKAVTARYTAEELLTRRAEVSKATVDYLQNKLTKYGIIVSDINVKDFRFSDQKFQDSINNKVIAEQDRQTTEKKLQTQTDVATANLNIAKVVNQQKLLEAQTTAEAIRIQAAAVQSQGGHDYVQLKIAEKWDGHSMPQWISGQQNVPMFVSGALGSKAADAAQ
ncbi:prohibitin family protein [Paraburkholderia youngii]|uniref:prohibitin family protein n=1 Tax=Paraburkholderia youngii TaxID=2782701 RepID=UPI003D1CBAAE